MTKPTVANINKYWESLCLSNKEPVFPVLAVTGKPEKEVDLEQYFKPTGILHCTTKFCNYGKAAGCKEYAQKQVGARISDLVL